MGFNDALMISFVVCTVGIFIGQVSRLLFGIYSVAAAPKEK